MKSQSQHEEGSKRSQETELGRIPTFLLQGLSWSHVPPKQLLICSAFAHSLSCQMVHSAHFHLLCSHCPLWLLFTLHVETAGSPSMPLPFLLQNSVMASTKLSLTADVDGFNYRSYESKFWEVRGTPFIFSRPICVPCACVWCIFQLKNNFTFQLVLYVLDLIL